MINVLTFLASVKAPEYSENGLNVDIAIKYEIPFMKCQIILCSELGNGPLTRYVKLRVAHAPGKFSPPPTSNETVS